MASSDTDILERVVRLAAAAGVDIHVATSTSAMWERWSHASLVLLGVDLAVTSTAFPSRAGVVLVIGEHGDEASAFRTAADISAEAVAVLPSAAGWLLERLGRLVPRRRGRVIAVMGAGAGAGASVFAALLACAADEGPVVLVDGDPVGSGHEHLLGPAAAPGTTWETLHQQQPVGLSAGGALAVSLPRHGHIGLLAGESRLDPAVVCAAVAALATATSHVIADLPPRDRHLAVSVVVHADVAVLVVPADGRGVSAAQRILGWTGWPRDLVIAVRTGPGRRLDPAQVGAHLSRPLCAVVADDSRVRAAGASGACDEVVRTRAGRVAHEVLRSIGRTS